MGARSALVAAFCLLVGASLYAEIPLKEDGDHFEKRLAALAEKYYVRLTPEQAQRLPGELRKYLEGKPQSLDRAFLDVYLGTFYAAAKEGYGHWCYQEEDPYWDEEFAMHLAKLKQETDVFIEKYFLSDDDWEKIEAQVRELRKTMEKDLRQAFAGLDEAPFLRMHHEIAGRDMTERLDNTFHPLETAVREQLRYFDSRLEGIAGCKAKDSPDWLYDAHFRRPLTDDDKKAILDAWQRELRRWSVLRELIPLWKAGVEDIQQKEPSLEKRKEMYEDFLSGGFLSRFPDEHENRADYVRCIWTKWIHVHKDGEQSFAWYCPGPSVWEVMRKFWAVPESEELKQAIKALEERDALERKKRQKEKEN